MPPLAAESLAGLLPALARLSGWVLGWLATYFIHSTVFVAGVWAFARSPLGRRLAHARRASLWRLALIGGLVTATLQSAGAPAPLTGTVRLFSGASSRVAYGVFLDSEARSAKQPRILTTRLEVRPLWPMVSVLVWLTGAVAGMGLLLLAKRRFAGSLAARRDEEFGVAGNALRELRRRAGVARPVLLHTMPDLASPVAIGRHEICLPERALGEFDLHHLEGILAHELAHLERRDATWLMTARVIEAVFFFQPLNRLARRRMVDASEFASDAWAVAMTHRPITLAKCLARVGEWASAEPLHAPAMVERRTSSLVERVRWLTSLESREDAGSPALMRAAMLCAVASAALLTPRTVIGRARQAPMSEERHLVVRVRQAGERGVELQRIASDSATFTLRIAPPRSY